MKPKPKVTTKSFYSIKPVRINRDELERLISIPVTAGYKVEYFDSSAEFDSIEDVISNRGKKPNELTLIFSKSKERWSGHFSLKIENAEIELSDLATRDKVTFYEMRDAILSLKTWWGTLANTWNWFFAFLFFTTILLNTLQILPLYLLRSIFIFSLLPLLGLAYTFIYIRLFCGLSLHRKHEGNFFQRNGDQILLLGIGALLGALSTLLATYIIKLL